MAISGAQESQGAYGGMWRRIVIQPGHMRWEIITQPGHLRGSGRRRPVAIGNKKAAWWSNSSEQGVISG